MSPGLNFFVLRLAPLRFLPLGRQAVHLPPFFSVSAMNAITPGTVFRFRGQLLRVVKVQGEGADAPMVVEPVSQPGQLALWGQEPLAEAIQATKASRRR